MSEVKEPKPEEAVVFILAAVDPENTPAKVRFAATLDQAAPGRHWTAYGPTAEAARANLLAFLASLRAPPAAGKAARRQLAKDAERGDITTPPAADGHADEDDEVVV